jgi:hypothetical protein
MKGIVGGTVICNIKSVPLSSFGLDEITGGWRKLHIEELSNLYIKYCGCEFTEEDMRV